MSMKTKYEIPGDVKRLYFRFVAAEKLRDVFVEMPYGFAAALKAGTVYEETRHEFWRKIRQIYPNLQTANLEYTWWGGLRVATKKKKTKKK